MVLSALRVDVPLNDIHDIYENMILETPCKSTSSYSFLYPPQTLFVGGILFSRCPSVRASVRKALFP